MGLIHIYCGDGKGKTTAAVGLAVRFAASGGNVLFYQFMKNGKSSECAALRQMPNITLLSGYTVSKFSFKMNELEKAQARKEYTRQFREITDYIHAHDEIGMLVTDEIMSCINCGFLPAEAVIDFLQNKPKHLEVVMTGREPDKRLIELADYVSEIKKIKHPYDKNISARKGIEF